MNARLASCAVLAALAAASPARAYPGQGVPNPRYPDGTGDVAVDQLNAGQLDQNYRGPWYYPRAAPAPYAPRPGYPPPAYPAQGYPAPYAQPPGY